MTTTTETPEIRVLHGALDESEIRGGSIILRGVIHPECLQLLKVDDYQRERRPIKALSSIWMAMKNREALPDIELGMRGQRFKQVKDGTIYLQDPVFIIDGLQRVSCALHYLDTFAADVRIGATIHFATSRDWERDRFRVLNTSQARVSPSILLRNLRETNEAVLTLYGLTRTKDFPLYNRVAWGQSMKREELMTAMVYAGAIVYLHRHLAGLNGRTADHFGSHLARVCKAISLNGLRENATTYFDLVEACWGIRTVEYNTKATWLRNGFMVSLSTVLADHQDFWRGKDGTELFIPAELRHKIKTFPVFDPSVANLVGSTGAGTLRMLTAMLIEHINSGKRTKRLTPRSKMADAEPEAA